MTLPAHELALPPFKLEHTLNVCVSVPLFVTLNVTVPVLSDLVESVNAKADGLPADRGDDRRARSLPGGTR